MDPAVTGTLIMCRGLPASGKSTWACEQVLADEPGQTIRVNRDDLRAMLHADRWVGDLTETPTLDAQEAVITVALTAGRTVIVDDTNLTPWHEQRLRGFAQRHGAVFQIQDFSNIGLEECIERDRAREHSVGEEVIRTLHTRHMLAAASSAAD